MSKQEKRLYEFGGFRLDPAERRLLRDGTAVPLAPKAFDLLLVLIQHSGHLLGKDRLLKEVWPGQFVEEGNLSLHISTLRKALSEGRAERQYIETVPKHGYRFIAAVRQLPADPVGENHTRRSVVIAEEGGGASGKVIDSLAVLPFVNVSADPDTEYLADGITESIISSHSRLAGLRVMARSTVFRYKGQEVDAREVGRELNAGAVLLGRVLQFGDRLIVRAELVDAADGSQLWGEQYNRKASDILAVQEEIANEISEKLRLRLTGRERQLLSKRYTENTEAYHAYLKGRYFFYKRTEEGLKKGVEYFQQAVGLDPTYALAYSGLADCYAVLGWLGESPPREFYARAKAAALKALELDDALTEAHTSLAFHRTFYELDWIGGEKELKRAIELGPSYALARHWYGWHLAAMGRFDESLAEMKQAQELDPLSPLMHTGLGSSLHLARRHDQAIEQYHKAVELDPNFALAHHGLGWAYEQKGMYGEAIRQFQKAVTLSAGNTLLVASLGHAYAASGERGAAAKTLDELEEQSRRKYVSPYGMAVGYTGLRQKGRALEWLEQAYAERSGWLVLLKVDPRFDSLRPDPRFADLMRRIGLAP